MNVLHALCLFMKVIFVVSFSPLASVAAPNRSSRMADSQYILIPKLAYIIPIRICNCCFLSLVFRQIDNALYYVQ